MSLWRSFDNEGGFDLPSERSEFDRLLQLLAASNRRAVLTNQRRSIAKNRGVGGKSRSQHLLGLAADYQVPPADVQTFMAAARRLGLTPVDETRVTAGTAPHVHVQRYPAGRIPERVYRQLGVQIVEVP